MMMKRLWIAVIFAFSTIFWALSFAQTPNFWDVLGWMHSIWLTKYNNVEQFRPFDSITRGEAAKFVAEYAALQTLPKNYTQCDFNDIAGYDSTLTPHIKQACFYGLMKWSNGQYRPNGLITEAEAITVVMRSVYGFFEETADPWYIAYYNRWVDLGLITNESLRWVGTTNISREKLGTWLYQAAQLQTSAGEFYTTNAGQAHYTPYSKSAFDASVANDKQVALFFHSKTCPICHGIREFINEGIADLPSDVRIYEIRFEENPDLIKQYGIKSQFTFVFFDEDGNPIETSNSVHLEQADTIDALLDRFE